MLVIVELVILFVVKNPAVANCAKLCAMPKTNAAAFFLFFLALCHLIPTHLFLYSFYIIPRRYYATMDEDLELSTDTRMLHQPLLEENMENLDQNINWQHGTPSRESGSVNKLQPPSGAGATSPKSFSDTSSRISNRLAGTRIKARSSFKG